MKKFVVMLSALMLMAVPALSLAAPTAGNNTVSSAAIIDGAVATVDIANKAVTAAKIADSTITASQMANGAVTTVKIGAGAVTADKLGIVCPSGQYLQYNGTTWVCSIGTAGPQGPAGPQGIQGIQGPVGPTGATAKYANVVVVAKSGGDFTNPVDAISAITDASSENPYLVKIMPGLYDITQIVTINGNIMVEGAGRDVTTLRSLVPNALQLSGLARGLANLTIKGHSADYSSAVVASDVSNATFQNLEINFETTGTFAKGIHLWSVQDVRIDNLLMSIGGTNPNSAGIKIEGTNSTVYVNNSIIKTEGNNTGIELGSVGGIADIANTHIVMKNNYNYTTFALAAPATMRIRNCRAFSDGLFNIGVFSGTLEIYNSEIITSSSLYSDSYAFGVYNSPEIKIANSKVVGTIGGGPEPGTVVKLFNVYDANYNSYVYP